MKIIIKQADFSKNGVDLNIKEILVDNRILQDFNSYTFTPGKYCIKLHSEVGAMLNENGQVNFKNIFWSLLDEEKDIYGYFTIDEQKNVILTGSNIDRSKCSLSIYKVENTNRYSIVKAPITTSFPSDGLILNPEKTYKLHIRTQYKGTQFGVYVDHNLVQSFIPTVGHEEIVTISNGSSLTLRTWLIGAKVEYFIEEV